LCTSLGIIFMHVLIGSARSSLPEQARAADLKFLHWLQQAREGTSNRKAARESYICQCPVASEVRAEGLLRGITNFGSGALTQGNTVARGISRAT
jgi:hypothetical protein